MHPTVSQTRRAGIIDKLDAKTRGLRPALGRLCKEDLGNTGKYLFGPQFCKALTDKDEAISSFAKVAQKVSNPQFTGRAKKFFQPGPTPVCTVVGWAEQIISRTTPKHHFSTSPIQSSEDKTPLHTSEMRNNQTSRNEHHTFYNEPKVFYPSNSNNSSRYPTLSIILPILHKLLHVTLKATVDDNNIVKEIKRVIGTDLELRYQE